MQNSTNTDAGNFSLRRVGTDLQIDGQFALAARIDLLNAKPPTTPKALNFDHLKFHDLKRNYRDFELPR